MMMAVVTLVAI